MLRFFAFSAAMSAGVFFALWLVLGVFGGPIDQWAYDRCVSKPRLVPLCGDDPKKKKHEGKPAMDNAPPLQADAK
jgi:hypothetical protein